MYKNCLLAKDSRFVSRPHARASRMATSLLLLYFYKLRVISILSSTFGTGLLILSVSPKESRIKKFSVDHRQLKKTELLSSYKTRRTNALEHEEPTSGSI